MMHNPVYHMHRNKVLKALAGEIGTFITTRYPLFPSA